MKALTALRNLRRAHRYARLREDHEIERWVTAIRKERVPMRDNHEPFDLVRTRGGLMIHRADCPWSGNGKQWRWAADKRLQELRVTVLRLGLRTCLHCCPLARS